MSNFPPSPVWQLCNAPVEYHIHCVVTAGAIADDGIEWINARIGFLFPVDVLKKVYCGKFLDFFKDVVKNKSIQFHGTLQEISPKYRQFIDTLYNTDWVVYLKKTFASPAAVVKYLGAYTNSQCSSCRSNC